jgi:adenine-specific DNA-methyltransferase
MSNKQKLELTWIGKENRPKLEPRILLEDVEKSYHANHRMTDNDIFDNRLIFGDNLLALKALETEFAGKVKCVFIDPPYNTGSAFAHYDDGLEHSIWLSLMRDRLEIIRRLLADDGSLWITIDDNEAHYLKVLCDEVLGRGNFVASNIWQKRYSRENREAIGDAHDYVLLYAKQAERFKATRNRVPITEEQAKIYKNPHNHPRGRWRGIPMTAQGYRPNQMYEIRAPGGAIQRPPEGRCWSTIESEFIKLREAGRIYFGKDNNSQPNIIRWLDEVEGFVPWTWWPHDEVGHTDEAKKEMHALFGKADAFITPKPERLLQRVLHIATNPGDLVLDSFAGSGTTGAVAHKMGRRWIMVELGEHCHTHIIPRLRKVIDGEDPGGITKAVDWQGGGGFRYYRLAPSLLEKDKWDNWVINKTYNAAMLAQALCKLEGFTFAPSDSAYWQHGYSTERDFIYVTTANLTHEQLQQLSDEVGPERSLLVLCTAFRGRGDYLYLTVKKIPKQVLSRCEWGHDDYSLRVENLPQASVCAKTQADKPTPSRQLCLFGQKGD